MKLQHFKSWILLSSSGRKGKVIDNVSFEPMAKLVTNLDSNNIDKSDITSEYDKNPRSITHSSLIVSHRIRLYEIRPRLQGCKLL
jgi:hypothetical protein